MDSEREFQNGAGLSWMIQKNKGQDPLASDIQPNNKRGGHGTCHNNSDSNNNSGSKIISLFFFMRFCGICFSLAWPT